jgi:isochorismate hydrolase
MSDYLSKENIDAKCSRWLRKVKPYNKEDLKLKIERAALLVIDMQRYFLNPEKSLGLPAGLAILPNVKALVGASRATSITRIISTPGSWAGGGRT